MHRIVQTLVAPEAELSTSASPLRKPARLPALWSEGSCSDRIESVHSTCVSLGLAPVLASVVLAAAAPASLAAALPAATPSPLPPVTRFGRRLC